MEGARSLLTCAALAAWVGCGGSSAPAAEPAADSAADPAQPSVQPGEGCAEAYAEYVEAWTRWFEVELEDEEAVAETVAAFREELPKRSGLAEMREVAVELRYEPGFERWIVALDATEHAIELCGEGASRPGA